VWGFIYEEKIKFSNMCLNAVEDYSKAFKSNEDWSLRNAVMNFENNMGVLRSEDGRVQEAWYKYEKSFPINKDFEISAHIKVPKFWDYYNKKEAQVGIGLFVGKKGNGGKIVYECDLCVISKEMRFVQGQMIRNRKGEDPIVVEEKRLQDEHGIISIKYDSQNITLALYFNENLIGVQKIDETGEVDWKMTADDEFEAGIMGFAEGTGISSNFPTIQDVSIG